MSISNVSIDSSIVQQSSQSIRSKAHADFEQLFKSIQAGNAAGAQQAYTALQQLQPSDQATAANAASTASTASTATTAVGGAAATPATTAFSSDWSSLGQALQSGNMASAQDAFSKIEQDLQAVAQETNSAQGSKHHHHHHGVSGTPSATTGSSATAAGMVTATTGTTAVGSDIKSLTQALQSGDTASAQDLLTKLEQDLQASGQTSVQHHRHGHGGFSTQNATGTYAAAATPVAVSAPTAVGASAAA